MQVKGSSARVDADVSEMGSLDENTIGEGANLADDLNKRVVCVVVEAQGQGGLFGCLQFGQVQP